MSALERAAEAAERAASPYETPDYLKVARAVLLSVRDLPDEVVRAYLFDNEYGYAMYYEGWKPTIDLIVNGYGQ